VKALAVLSIAANVVLAIVVASFVIHSRGGPLGPAVLYDNITAMERFEKLEGELFQSSSGTGTSSTGDQPDRQAFSRQYFAVGTLRGAEGLDPREALVKLLQRLAGDAERAGFGVVESGFCCRSYGPDAALTGQDRTWTAVMRNREARTLQPVTLRGGDRFVYASLTFLNREDLAMGFRWTITLDATTGKGMLETSYHALGPVYPSRRTPELYILSIRDK